jgi:hypothetical protein
MPGRGVGLELTAINDDPSSHLGGFGKVVVLDRFESILGPFVGSIGQSQRHSRWSSRNLRCCFRVSQDPIPSEDRWTIFGLELDHVVGLSIEFLFRLGGEEGIESLPRSKLHVIDSVRLGVATISLNDGEVIVIDYRELNE